MKKSNNVNAPKTIFAISWLSETSASETCAGVYPTAFATHEEAENKLREMLDSEKYDMLSRYDEEEIVVDYDKGVVYDESFDEYVKYEIHEVEVKL